jgi:hypothetical protein
MDRRDVDADFLEDAPAHDGHDTASAAGALPGLALEAANRQIGEPLGVVSSKGILEPFECVANEIPQLFEPSLGAGLAV